VRELKCPFGKQSRDGKKNIFAQTGKVCCEEVKPFCSALSQ